jgi:exoribonuclease R
VLKNKQFQILQKQVRKSGGKRTKRVIRMGDEVYVKVKKADIAKKQLDFTLIL